MLLLLPLSFLSCDLLNKFAINDPPKAFTCFFSLFSRSAFNFFTASLSFFCSLANIFLLSMISFPFLLPLFGFIADSVIGSDSSMPNPSNVKLSSEASDGNSFFFSGVNAVFNPSNSAKLFASNSAGKCFGRPPKSWSITDPPDCFLNSAALFFPYANSKV